MAHVLPQVSPQASPLGRSAPAILPARVERAIAAEQDRSERIIGWFQMGVVLLFGALYAISPPPPA